MYSVVVSNIGTVIVTASEEEAQATFLAYRDMSDMGYGRAAGEDVTLFRDGEPLKEYHGSNED